MVRTVLLGLPGLPSCLMQKVLPSLPLSLSLSPREAVDPLPEISVFIFDSYVAMLVISHPPREGTGRLKRKRLSS